MRRRHGHAPGGSVGATAGHLGDHVQECSEACALPAGQPTDLPLIQARPLRADPTANAAARTSWRRHVRNSPNTG